MVDGAAQVEPGATLTKVRRSGAQRNCRHLAAHRPPEDLPARVEQPGRTVTRELACGGATSLGYSAVATLWALTAYEAAQARPLGRSGRIA